jgi:predicted nucleic acid-binding protein
VNVVDSSGWLEYFGDGPNAAFFAGPLAKADELIVPAISVFEVFKRVLQQRDEAAALQAAALMQQGRTVALDPALAMAAAKISHELKLPRADSFILATARQFNAVLWTQGGDFEKLPGVRYVAATTARS